MIVGVEGLRPVGPAFSREGDISNKEAIAAVLAPSRLKPVLRVNINCPDFVDSKTPRSRFITLLHTINIRSMVLTQPTHTNLTDSTLEQQP